MNEKAFNSIVKYCGLNGSLVVKQEAARMYTCCMIKDHQHAGSGRGSTPTKALEAAIAAKEAQE